MIKYVVEVKASDSSARLGKWAYPARIWVRGYDETDKKKYQWTIGYADKRNTGPRSRYYVVFREAVRWMTYFNSKEDINTPNLLNEFGKMCLEKYNLETLEDKLEYSTGKDKDCTQWEMSKEEWDYQIAYACAVKYMQQQSKPLH